jgi:hypothetical protein
VTNNKHEHDHDYRGIELKPIGLPADLEPAHHHEESRESILMGVHWSAVGQTGVRAAVG